MASNLPTSRFGQLAAGGGTLKVIDVSDRPESARVVRDGRTVPALRVREDVANSIVAPDLLDVRFVQPRVLSQSIAAGTRVPRGTTVDLVLVSRAVVPAGTFEGVHADLSERTLEQLALTFLADDAVRRDIAAAASFEELPAATRARIDEIAADEGIVIDEGDPARRHEALHETLRIAGTFAG